MCSCLRGVSRWFTPLACGPGYPELSKSYMDMASKLFTLHYTINTLSTPLMHKYIYYIHSCRQPSPATVLATTGTQYMVLLFQRQL